MREFFILLRMLTAFLLPRALQGLHTAQLEHIMVMGDLNVCPHITPAGYKKLEEDGFDLALRLQSDGTKWASNAPNAGTANPRTPRLFDNMLFQPRRSSVLRAFLRTLPDPCSTMSLRCLCNT